MSSERPNPIADVVEGAVKGVLLWSEEKVKEAARRFGNREYAFVSDTEVINTTKELRKTSEMSLFKQYVEDHDLHILFSMGLTLRKYQRDKERVQSVRANIFDRYGSKGLHIAELVQNGLFNRYLANALERTRSSDELRSEIRNFLENIEDHVHFAQETDDPESVAQSIIIKIVANNPKTFIICSSGYTRYGKFPEIVRLMAKWVHTGTLNYRYERYIGTYTHIFFLNKMEL